MTQTKVIALVIARLTSSRLPKKQLRLIAGKPMIYHIIAHLKQVPGLDEIVLATASKAENRELANYVAQFDIPTYFDDDENDVTGRIARAANCFEADNIVTISGDCPLIHPPFVAEGLRLLTENNADYVFVDKKKYKCLHEGIGFFSSELWQAMDKRSTTWFHKEHPGSVLSEIESGFMGVEVIPEPQFRRDDFRLSVDTVSDLEFMNFVFGQCSQGGKFVELNDVVELVDEKPFVRSINGHVHQKGVTEQGKKIAVVTHACEKVGMGHLARCIALANELKEAHGTNVTFYVNDDPGTGVLLERHSLKANVWRSMIELSEKLRSDVHGIDGTLIDLKAQYCDELLAKTGRLQTPTILVDHVPTDANFADLLIIPSLFFDYKNKAGHFTKNKILSGKNYLLLNRKISWLREINQSRDSILVTAGGSGNFSNKIFARLAKLTEFEKVKLLAGPFVNAGHIYEKAAEFGLKNYEVIFNPADVLQVYSQAKIALCTFGVTTYELLALGVPTVITGTLHEQDNLIVDELVKRNACIDGRPNTASHDAFMSPIENILKNEAMLDKIAEQGKQLIDGLGVRRVSGSIMELVSSSAFLV